VKQELVQSVKEVEKNEPKNPRTICRSADLVVEEEIVTVNFVYGFQSRRKEENF